MGGRARSRPWGSAGWPRAAAWAAIGLALAGCAATAPWRDTPAATQTALSPASAVTPGWSLDVPMPANAEVRLDDSLVLGSDEAWIGRLILVAEAPVPALYDFYDKEMANLGWEPVAKLRGAINTLIYVRGGRIATIAIEGSNPVAPLVTIVVLPRSAPAESGP